MSTPWNGDGSRRRMLHVIDDSSSESEGEVPPRLPVGSSGGETSERGGDPSGYTGEQGDSIDDIAEQLLGLDIRVNGPSRNVWDKNKPGKEELAPEVKDDAPTIPHHVEERLFDHQRVGLQWLLNLYKIPSGGILADDMGLWKTLQVTAFVSALLNGKLARRVLVLAPKTLIPAWEKEVKICELFHMMYEYCGDKKSRLSVLNKIVKEGGILVTSYGMVQHNADQLRQHEWHDEDDGDLWDIVIMDEGHRLKNKRAQLRQKIESIPAKMRLIITGTPIQNNLMELHSLFDLVCPDLLGSIQEFKSQFAKPIVKGTDKNATRREREDAAIVSESLRKTYAPFMLRRTKEGVFHTSSTSNEDHSATTSKAPSKSPILMCKKKDMVVWLRLTKNQEKLYRAFLESKTVASVLNKTSSALASLTVLKKICDHPALLSENAQETILEVQAQAEDPGKITQSLYEMRNSTEWRSVLDELHTSEIRASCKSIFVLSLLQFLIDEDHRTLVFSQSKVMLNILEAAIVSKGWNYLRIDGSIPSSERRARVDRFQNDTSILVFLLTSQVGGLGLTLTGADRVIIVDPSWNPSVDSQSVDRAYRIGQKRDVLVYRLVSCGTIEDKIYRKQVFKGALFKAGTECGEQLRYFSLSDLQDLFKLDPSETIHSSTHTRLEELHGHQREISVSMSREIKTLGSFDQFVGVSDHDLLYSHKQDVPEDVLSRARVFRPTEKQIPNPTGYTTQQRPQGKHPVWDGDDQLSAMFGKALSLEDDTQKEKSRLSEELSNQRKLLQNQALVASLPDKGQRIVTRIRQLEEELQAMDKSTSHDDIVPTESLERETQPDNQDLDVLERVQAEIQNNISPQKVSLQSLSGKTTTGEEKAIMLRHVMKQNKKALYLKALDLEKSIEDKTGQEIDLLRKEVEALLEAFVESKQALDACLK